jgi:GNAT superfamily N-acetyltransferase
MDIDLTKVSTAVPTGLSPDDSELITLRPATAADAAGLALVGAATFLEAFTWMLPGADIIAHCARYHTPEAYAHYLALPTTRITLAVTGIDAPIGFAMVTAPDLPTLETLATDVELKRIYLFSRFRTAATPVAGQPNIRAGHALMNAAIESARELGATRLLLGVNAGNERALGFYRRNGFEVVGTRTFQVGSQTCSDLLFARQIDSVA